VATKPAQAEPIIDWLSAIESPRIIPFASIHPDHEDLEQPVALAAERGIKGLKFHTHYMNCPADDERSIRLCRFAAKHGLAMVYHAGFDLGFPDSDIASPVRIRRLYEAVPELTLQACHMGGFRNWELVLEHLAGLPIYFDTSFALGHCPKDLMAAIIDKHPKTHIMYGSDAPWSDPVDDLGLLMDLELDEQTLQMVAWENACRFAGVG
jgi:predicted TIM-barrel fold metal-dependent hydrolase